MKKLRWPSILMVIAIIAVTGFQLYWLKNNYDREKQSLDMRTMYAFRQTILRLQASKLGFDRINFPDSSFFPDGGRGGGGGRVGGGFGGGNGPGRRREPTINVINIVQERLRDMNYGDSGNKKTKIVIQGTNSNSQEIYVEKNRRADSIDDDKKNKQDSVIWRGNGGSMFGDGPFPGEGGRGRNNNFFRFLYSIDSLSLKDSITLKEIDSAYTTKLKEDKVNVSFDVEKLTAAERDEPHTVVLGFSKPMVYRLNLNNILSYMLDKLKMPILFSLLLIGLTILSFVLLYKNMRKQQRLAELKNEFISNITHELKTPITTVGVAIEALKNFNAIQDPERTREYLDISQNELQRLNLLVDKVLKLSMFEKKEVELKYEIVNLEDIAKEVISSMKLQIEKHRAEVELHCIGSATLQADRLHLLSVVFNLVDNALKYGKNSPKILINIEEKEHNIEMKLSDNGIGISAEYQSKVFEKFFRVPHGDTHNAKGYGLGLSYVAHVINKHKGTITVNSVVNEGTTFTISLPKKKI